jgi:hypothetical protein
MPQIIITIVFGFLWWLVFNHVGAGLAYLMILGSVLAVCVCCCKGGECVSSAALTNKVIPRRGPTRRSLRAVHLQAPVWQAWRGCAAGFQLE